MRPNISRDLKIGWYSLGGVALVCGVALWLLWGALQERRARVVTAAHNYQKRQGFFPYEYPEGHELRGEGELAKADKGLKALRDDTVKFKGHVGLNKASPFILPPEDAPDRGYYFVVVYDQLREDLRELARRRSEISFADGMGFRFPDHEPPDAAEAEHWATMLQLVSKATFLALKTNFEDGLDGLRHISISDLRNGHRVPTGPAKRPPLLREYPFTLKVEGSLKDILWLLHQLSADQSTAAHQDYHRLLRRVARKVKATVEELDLQIKGMDIKVKDIHTGPLIVRGLTISSENSRPVDQISQLSATFHLAGMDFLSADERRKRKEIAARRAAEARPDKPLKKLKPKF